MNISIKMHNNIKAHHSHLTEQYIKSLTTLQKLRFMHPTDRLEVINELRKEGIFSSLDIVKMKLIGKGWE